MNSSLRILSVALVASFAVGCQAESYEPEVSAAEAKLIAEQALAGFNAGDYDAWSAQWSEHMKETVSEADFQAQREQLVASAGKWISVQYVQLQSAQPDGYVVYALATKFQNAPVTMRLIFPEDGAKIESVTLQKIQQNDDSGDQECPEYLEDCQPL